jgi:hypothetical protein
MLDADALARHADALAAAVRMLGPTERSRVLGMLRALPLLADEAGEVVAYALANGILERDGDTLRAP